MIDYRAQQLLVVKIQKFMCRGGKEENESRRNSRVRSFLKVKAIKIESIEKIVLPYHLFLTWIETPLHIKKNLLQDTIYFPGSCIPQARLFCYQNIWIYLFYLEDCFMADL